jgi:hypothetical protein
MTDHADVKLDLVLRQRKTINGEPRTLKATSATIVDMLDLAAGPISAVLYIAVQIAANPALLGTDTALATESPRRLLLFAVVISLSAWFIFDAVCRKLAQTGHDHSDAGFS